MLSAARRVARKSNASADSSSHSLRPGRGPTARASTRRLAPTGRASLGRSPGRHLRAPRRLAVSAADRRARSRPEALRRERRPGSAWLSGAHGTGGRSSRVGRGLRRSSRGAYPPHTSARPQQPRASRRRTRAADIDSAATMSSPTSPFRRLRTIWTKSAARTGTAPADQTKAAGSGSPASERPRPKTSPIRAIASSRDVQTIKKQYFIG